MAPRTGFRRATNRPNYDWEGVTTLASGLAAASVTEAQLFTADTAETLVRVRGWANVALTSAASAANDRAIVAAGLIVAPTGVTVAVDPINEPGANWLWHQFFPVETQGVIGAVSDQGAQGWISIEIDNKAMRKLREDESVFIVVANQNISGSPTVNFMAGIRILTRR